MAWQARRGCGLLLAWAGGAACAARPARTRGGAAQPAAPRSRRRYAKAEARDPDARRREAVHRRSTRRVTPSRTYPIMLLAHAVRRRARTAPTRTARRSARRSASRTPGSSSSTRTCAESSAPRASSCRCGRTSPSKAPRRRSTRRATPTTPSSGCWRTSTGHNGRVGMWGISYPGFYTSMGAIDAHPALKAVSPQAPVGDWFIGDDFRHNGAFFLAHAFRWITYHGRTRPTPATSCRRASRCRRPTATRFFLGVPVAQRDRSRGAQGRGGVLDRSDRARDLRCVLAGARRAAAPEEHHAGLARRRRLVRRRGSVRRARNLPRDRAS